MTEPTRDALHAETLGWLAAYDQQTTRTDEQQCLAYAAECVKRVPELEAEVERLRAKAAIVDAMQRGEIHVARGSDQWAIYHTGLAKKFRAPTLLAAYAAATREGADG